MQSFREAVKAALKSAATNEEKETPWEGVLREFGDSINEAETSVLAFLRRGAAPTVRHLMLAPKGRRDHNQTLLSVAVEPDVVAVLSGERREFTMIEDFQKFLVSLARLSAFRESLDELKAMANEPVTGFLRSGKPLDRSPSRDIIVKVSAEEQHRLADAAETSPPAPIAIYVEPTGPSPLGQGVFDPQTPARWLVAGGYVLAIEKQTPEPSRVRLEGTPEPPLNAQ